jgi:DNA-binding NarL/FixJ family response regulator
MEVLNAGAKGYVLKTDAPRDLVAAVLAVRGNKSFFTPRISRLISDGYFVATGKSRRMHDKVFLSPRQQQVLELIAAGYDTREIASTLKVTLKTAETHRANLMRRLNCNSVAQVSRYALRNELVRAWSVTSTRGAVFDDCGRDRTYLVEVTRRHTVLGSGGCV